MQRTTWYAECRSEWCAVNTSMSTGRGAAPSAPGELFVTIGAPPGSLARAHQSARHAIATTGCRIRKATTPRGEARLARYMAGGTPFITQVDLHCRCYLRIFDERAVLSSAIRVAEETAPGYFGTRVQRPPKAAPGVKIDIDNTAILGKSFPSFFESSAIFTRYAVRFALILLKPTHNWYGVVPQNS
jgi:hypothetical protein